MRARAGALVLALGASALGPGPAAAQGDATPSPLRFEEAVQVALERSPVYQRQLNAVTMAEYGERSSFGTAFLPNLSASLGFNGSTFRRKTAEDDFGNPIGGTEYVENTTSSTSQGLGSGVTLLDLRSWRAYGQALSQTAFQEAAAALGAARLRTQVGQAYFDALRADRLIAVEERQLESARRQLTATQELLRLAAKQPTDVLGAELQVSQAEQSLQQAVGAARKARLQLKQTMGVSLQATYELASDFPPVFDPGDLNHDALIERALRESPSLLQQTAQLESAERGLSVARAARFPTISGNASWGRSTNARDYEAFRELTPPNQSWGFGFSVSVPLFSRFSASSQIGRAAMEVRNAEESVREARLQLEREARAAVIDLESAYTSVRLAERSAEIARSRLTQGEELYRLGSIGYTELQRMFDDVARAERGVVSAYAQFAYALLQLEEKVGGPLERTP
ncbi:MAG: TolC family protein [Gemmatimonadota bacterium]